MRARELTARRTPAARAAMRDRYGGLRFSVSALRYHLFGTMTTPQLVDCRMPAAAASGYARPDAEDRQGGARIASADGFWCRRTRQIGQTASHDLLDP